MNADELAFLNFKLDEILEAQEQIVERITAIESIFTDSVGEFLTSMQDGGIGGMVKSLMGRPG